MTKPHYLYLFIGNCIGQLDKKKRRFVVQSENPIHEYERVKGKVVACAEEAPYELGYYSDNWANPIKDVASNLFPSFVRIPFDDCRTMFPDNRIVDYPVEENS